MGELDDKQAPGVDATDDRLDSWKEIASFFGRGVTTVQRWEEVEALPVHRHEHAKRGTVYAFKSELKRWHAARAVAASPEPGTAERPKQPQYKGFISYSHAAQGALAPVLQSALQQFAKPFYRLRAIRVFRDETSLALTPGLWPTIQKALRDSEYFILIASPSSAASEWVQKEVGEWLRLNGGTPDKLLIVLAEGQLAWSAVANDFDWALTTALPENLRGTFQTEPFYLDFRWATGSAQLSSRNPQFLRGVAKLASALGNIPLDTMIGEDVRQHRITRIVTTIAAGALVTLGVATSIAAYIAITQRDSAVQQARIALAGRLAAQSQVAYGQQGDLLERGVLLALDGFAVREAFFVSFLGTVGVGADEAFAAGFLFFLVTVALAAPGGAILLWESLRGGARPRLESG